MQYAGLLSTLCQKSRAAVRELDPSNDVTFLRLRSHKHEILVAPDKEYVLVVIQAPQVKPPAPAGALDCGRAAFASLLCQLGFRLRSGVMVMPEGGGTLVAAQVLSLRDCLIRKHGTRSSGSHTS